MGMNEEKKDELEKAKSLLVKSASLIRKEDTRSPWDLMLNAYRIIEKNEDIGIRELGKRMMAVRAMLINLYWMDKPRKNIRGKELCLADSIEYIVADISLIERKNKCNKKNNEVSNRWWQRKI